MGQAFDNGIIVQSPAISRNQIVDPPDPIIVQWRQQSANENQQEQQWGNILNNEFIDVWDFNVCPLGDFFPTFVNSKDPGKKNGFQKGESDQPYGSGPIIIFVEYALLKEKDRGKPH